MVLCCHSLTIFFLHAKLKFFLPCVMRTFHLPLTWQMIWPAVFLTWFLIARKYQWQRLIQERKFLQIWLNFFIAYTVNSTKLFKIHVKMCQKMNWEVYLWLMREKLSLTQPVFLVMPNVLVTLHYFKLFTQEFYIITQKLCS